MGTIQGLGLGLCRDTIPRDKANGQLNGTRRVGVYAWTRLTSFIWVAVKPLNLSYHNGCM